MSYDVSFKAKIEGKDVWVPIGCCEANITSNVRKIIMESTGLPWKNGENNGLCMDIMPCIAKGLDEFKRFPEKYKPLEASNGWGTVKGTIRFFEEILNDWEEFVNCTFWQDIADVATFWIE